MGNPCRFGTKRDPVYGRELPIGVYDKDSDRKHVTLTKSFRKLLRIIVAEQYPNLKKSSPEKHGVERDLKKFFWKFFRL